MAIAALELRANPPGAHPASRRADRRRSSRGSLHFSSVQRSYLRGDLIAPRHLDVLPPPRAQAARRGHGPIVEILVDVAGALAPDTEVNFTANGRKYHLPSCRFVCFGRETLPLRDYAALRIMPSRLERLRLPA